MVKETKEIRARFSKGVIEPLEKVDLEEGKEIDVIIFSISKGKRILEVLRSTAGGWRNLIDAEELERNMYADRLISNRPTPKL